MRVEPWVEEAAVESVSGLYSDLLAFVNGFGID